MLGHTTRLEIIEELISLLEGLDVKQVICGRAGSVQEEFIALPDTNFPIIVLEAGLPQPEIKYSSRQQGTIDEVLSNLSIDISVYSRFVESPEEGDEGLSVILQALWRGICNSPNVGRALKITPTFSPKITYVDNYCYFTMNLVVRYNHDKDTI